MAFNYHSVCCGRSRVNKDIIRKYVPTEIDSLHHNFEETRVSRKLKMEQFCKRAFTGTLYQLSEIATLGVLQHSEMFPHFQRDLCVQHPRQPLASQVPHGLGKVSQECASLSPNVDLAAIEHSELDRLKEG